MQASPQKWKLHLAGVWSWPVKILAILLTCILTIAGHFMMILEPAYAALATQQTEEERLKKAFIPALEKINALQVWEDGQAALDLNLNAATQRLVHGPDIPLLMGELPRLARLQNLRLDLAKAGQSSPETLYTILPIQLRLEGTYPGFAGFVQALTSLPYITTLHDISITPLPQQPGHTEGTRLLIIATLKVYSHPDKST